MEDQQKFNQLLNEINVYKQQGDLIQQQIELVRASIAEVDALTNTLDDLEGKDSVEHFRTCGCMFLSLKVNFKNTDEVIVSIGSGIAVKKDVDGARETIARQKKDLEDSLDKMLANMQQVSDIIGSLSAQAEQLAAVAQGNMSATGLN